MSLWYQSPSTTFHAYITQSGIVGSQHIQSKENSISTAFIQHAKPIYPKSFQKKKSVKTEILLTFSFSSEKGYFYSHLNIFSHPNLFQITIKCNYCKQYNVSSRWQKLAAFRRGQKWPTKIRQARISYFRDKCVVFARNFFPKIYKKCANRSKS